MDEIELFRLHSVRGIIVKKTIIDKLITFFVLMVFHRITSSYLAIDITIMDIRLLQRIKWNNYHIEWYLKCRHEMMIKRGKKVIVDQIKTIPASNRRL